MRSFLGRLREHLDEPGRLRRVIDDAEQTEIALYIDALDRQDVALPSPPKE